MSSAAYLALLAQPAVSWTVLAEVQVRQALRGWTSEGSSAYSVPFSLMTHPAARRLDLGLYRGLDAVWEGVTALTLRASVALVKANAGSYFYDSTTSKLYVRTAGSANPDTLSLLQALGTVRLATRPTTFTDQPPYDGQIDASGLPSLESSRPDLLRGISAYPSGNLSAVNADGFWDYLSDISQGAGWLWMNNTVRFLLGAQTLLYSEYEALATMQMSAPPMCGDLTAVFQLRSISNALKTSFPRHTVQDFYTALIALVGGTPSASLPMWWGVMTEVPLVLIGQLVSMNRWVSGDMFYLENVTYSNIIAVERATGVRTVLTDIGTGGTDYLVLGGGDKSIEIITSWDAATYDIIADVSQVAQTCGAVARRILICCGIPMSLIDTASFTQADLDNPATIGLWAGVMSGSADVSALVSGADLLDEIAKATFCAVTLGNTGLWTAKVWDPSFDLATTQKLTDVDLLDIGPPLEVPVLSTGIKVQYARKVYADTWSETTSARTAAPYEQNTDQTDTQTVRTCLATAADAATHADRLALLDSRPKVLHEIVGGPVLMNYAVGDKVRIARSRGPSITGTFDQVMEIEKISKRVADMTVRATVGNQRGLGESVKRIAPNGTPDWASASADERRQYLFLADNTTNMVDTADPSTYLQAVLW